MSEPRKEEAVELSGEDLGELAAQLKDFLEIRDRAYGFPVSAYERCFVGSEAVAAMVARGIAADAVAADCGLSHSADVGMRHQPSWVL